MAIHKFDKVEFDSKEASKVAAKAVVKKATNVKDVADRVAAIEAVLGIA